MYREYSYAALTREQAAALDRLQEELARASGRHIVLIAYEGGAPGAESGGRDCQGRP